jgi:hypothetical protein
MIGSGKLRASARLEAPLPRLAVEEPERLPGPRAALVILGLSASLWVLIIAALRLA